MTRHDEITAMVAEAIERRDYLTAQAKHITITDAMVREFKGSCSVCAARIYVSPQAPDPEQAMAAWVERHRHE